MIQRVVRSSAMVAVLGLFGMAVAFLLLSDRAPALFGIVRDGLVTTGTQLEAELGVNVVDRDDIPGTNDQIGHAALWGTAMILVGWTFRKWLPVPLCALAMGALSVFSEIAQSRWSATRVAQASDAAANLVGIGAAAVVLVLGLAVGRWLAADGSAREDGRESESGPTMKAPITEEMPVYMR